MTNAKDGQTFTTLERKINLVTIKSISMSNLRDDWFVSNLRVRHEIVLSANSAGSEPWSDRRGRPDHQLCLQDGIGDSYAQIDSREYQRSHRTNVSTPDINVMLKLC